MVGAVGRDAVAEDALAGLRRGGCDARPRAERRAHRSRADPGRRARARRRLPSRPGANASLGGVRARPTHDAVLCQLEIPDAAVLVGVGGRRPASFCLNAAPARAIEIDPDLTVVNRYELELLGRRDGLVAVTLGAEGAVLLEDGEEIARAAPPARRRRRRHCRRRRVHRVPARLAARGARRGRGARPCVRSGGACGVAARRAAVAPDGGGGRRARRLRCAAIIGRCPRRSSSTATPGTTTRSRCCSRSRAPSSRCWASRPPTGTRRWRRRPRTRSACSSSPAGRRAGRPRRRRAPRALA